MAWATMLLIGYKGYVSITKDIVDTTFYIADELKKMKEIKLIAKPEVSIVSIESSEFNILRMLDEMVEKGWHLNATQYPSG